MFDKNSSIMPFILGAGFGAVVALLLSPKSGEDIRKGIAEGVNEGGRQIAAGGRKLKQRVEKMAGEAQDHVQEAIDAGQEAYHQASNG